MERYPHNAQIPKDFEKLSTTESVEILFVSSVIAYAAEMKVSGEYTRILLCNCAEVI